MQEKGKRLIINLKQMKLKIELVQKILNQEKIWTTTYILY